MTAPEIIALKPIDMATLKDEINRIKVRDKEPNLRVGKVEEYLNSFSIIEKKKSEELLERILKLNIPRIKELHVMKMVDIMPKTLEELKILISAYPISVSVDNLKKIVKALNEEK